VGRGVAVPVNSLVRSIYLLRARGIRYAGTNDGRPTYIPKHRLWAQHDEAYQVTLVVVCRETDKQS
jgi:hypothetical protein